MHSLETGVVVSIAAFFFFSFLTFTFLRESNISKEVSDKYVKEKAGYEIGNTKSYEPEILNDVVNIIIEEAKILHGEEAE